LYTIVILSIDVAEVPLCRLGSALPELENVSWFCHPQISACLDHFPTSIHGEGWGILEKLCTSS